MFLVSLLEGSMWGGCSDIWRRVLRQNDRKRPQLKFLKDQVGYVLNGSKTLEPRPRSSRWIERIFQAEEIELTYGPRFSAPRVFAIAKIEKVEVRPFETTTKDDLIRISRGWENKEPEEFIRVHNEWYSKELAKGYPVVWIYFKLELVKGLKEYLYGKN